MTNQDVRRIALQQSAYDSNCIPEDFLANQSKVVLSCKNDRARKYLELPFVCDLTSYGSCIVASVADGLQETVGHYIHTYPVEHCFETPNMLILQRILDPYGADICFMAEYFLPDVNCIHPQPCAYEIRFLSRAQIEKLYLQQWSNALCEKRKELDVLAIAAFDGDTMIGVAGCSADCETMWQIGVDVLPAYRRQGVASALTSRLALETLARGKVPFYCCAWSNIGSARNAIRSGFRPAWVQLTAKKKAFIHQMNNEYQNQSQEEETANAVSGKIE